MTRRQILSIFLPLSGCGYHVGGRSDLLPGHIQTIAIPAIKNLTSRHNLADRLTSTLTREFVARTRYQIITDPSQADAVLTCTILSVTAYPTTIDPGTNRAAAVQIQLTLAVKLIERTTGKLLIDRPTYEFRERYEASIDQTQYFDESDQALMRISRDVSRTIVSYILAAF